METHKKNKKLNILIFSILKIFFALSILILHITGEFSTFESLALMLILLIYNNQESNLK